MKTLFTSTIVNPASFRRGLLLLCSAAAVPALAQTAPPAFPRNETFKGNSASNFTFGGAARLTGVGTTGNDPVGQGYLRLTDDVNHQAGYVIDNVGFPSSAGFSISFEFFSYGGDGADGFSVFLVDADKQPSSGFRIGATGGSLGYAQKTVDPIAPGVSSGYIGIGIDEFGNYSNNREGRSGGNAALNTDGRVPDGVAIRGAGNGSAATDYPFLTGTNPGDLGFSLDVPTARAQSGSADYRRAYIDVVPTTVGETTTYRITVRIQHGLEVRTTVENFVVPTPPAKLRLGFSGSTGGNTNIHEIRNLNIVQVPFASDDVAETAYNRAVEVSVLANDVAPGSSIDPNSVDLDPATTGLQSTLEVPGKGTFSVDETGLVTFTPLGTFAGRVSALYTMRSVLGDEYASSPANINVTVRGADLKATLTGPKTANGGQKVTYTVATTNQGSLTALNTVPFIQLPANLPMASVAPTSGGTYDAATGKVTFATIASLTAADPAVLNAVTVTLPTKDMTNLVSQAEVWSDVPDPETTNNISSVTTGVGAPLPVELVRFTAVAADADVMLNWNTALEYNSSRFEVERSRTGKDFELVTRVQAQGTTTRPTSYQYLDAGAGRNANGVLYYRLRQVDTDGQAHYSSVQTVRFTSRNIVAPATLYPNPHQQSSPAPTLDLSGLPAGSYAVQVRDVVGRVVWETTAEGAHRNPLAIGGLRPGTYIVQVKGAQGVTSLPLVQQ
ncbi:T9SS C-terminal target domain-containing protein [Hymenobacter sediminis]|uniref:Ig-like domain-containing protein n=1 Tax=Hymenobacter sediminis TaxID=2218621 RepID=UPI000DA64939|nr:T9SS type A sorting domain-containing protein [Hymenobacter sediminis]RPD46207.1 T9SS C-terminal target domain-containing protein [Hymenobacter sediminis]